MVARAPRMRSLTPSLSVAPPTDGGGSAMWAATVTTAAVRECGGLVRDTWDPCAASGGAASRQPLAASDAMLTLELPEVRRTSIGTTVLVPVGR